MSDEKTQPNTGPANSGAKTSTAWESIPFQEMMEKWMTGCGCRSEDMASLWETCCGMSLEKKKNPEI